MRPTRLLAPLALLLVVLGACERPPEDGLPAGTLWSGDARAARAFLTAVEGLAGTPAALRAQDLEQRLAGCERFLAFCATGQSCSLATTIDCHPAGGVLAQADAARGGASWIFAHHSEQARLTAWGLADGPGWRVRATLVDEGGTAAAAPWRVLLPARRAAAPAVLADRHALLHLRLRSDRGLASLGSDESAGWAGQLFGLKSELFAAMALEGTTELAVYEPLPRQLIPPLALAVDVRNQEGATAALEQLLARVHARWGASRTPWQLGPYRGACISDLNVLPELAPCYVATEGALVLGWNPLSVAAALTQGIDPPGPPSEGGILTLHLDRFPVADERLRDAYADATTPRATLLPPASPGYPWSRVTLSGSKDWHGRYRLELVLAAAASAAASP